MHKSSSMWSQVKIPRRTTNFKKMYLQGKEEKRGFIIVKYKKR